MSSDIILQLDETPGVPIFLRLVNVIIRDIERGRLKPGTRLPGTRALAQSLGIHRNTVDAAYQELILQGWVVSRPARGSYVSDDLPEQQPLAQRPRGATKPAPVQSGNCQRRMLAFSDGAPDPRIAPRAELARAFRRALSSPGFLDGAAYGDPRGSLSLRTALAGYLADERGVTATLDEILVTRGSQMALFLIARTVLTSGDIVAVEEPGYPLARTAFRAVGADVVGVPVDAQGIRVDRLAELAAQHPRLRAIYVTPHHQYPTTATMSAARRLKLLALARDRQLLVIEDDYDHEYRFACQPVLPLVARGGADCVVYVGSLSKLLAPAIRLGYVVAPPDLVLRMGDAREAIDRQGDLPMEQAIAALIEDGELRRHARKARRLYQARRDLLADALRDRFGDTVAFDPPAGGLALWMRLTDGTDAEHWAAAAAGIGLIVEPGLRFVLDATAPPQAFRLGYASLDDKQLRQATGLLATAKPGPTRQR